MSIQKLCIASVLRRLEKGKHMEPGALTIEVHDRLPYFVPGRNRPVQPWIEFILGDREVVFCLKASAWNKIAEYIRGVLTTASTLTAAPVDLASTNLIEAQPQVNPDR